VSDIGTVSPSKGLYWRLCLLGLGLFLVGTNAVVIAGLLPQISDCLGTSRAEVSYSITLYALFVAIGSPVIATLVPRWSRTALIATGLGLVAVSTVLAASATDLPVFMVGRALAGLGGAALIPATTAAAASIAPPEKQGRAIAIIAAGFTMAAAAGAPLGTALGSVAGWRVPLYVVAALAALTAVALLIFVRNVPMAPAIRLRDRFVPLRSVPILMVLLSTLLMVTALNVVYIFSSAITEPETGNDGSLLALLLFLFGISGIAGSLTGGFLIDRFGSRLIATLTLAVHVLSLFAVFLFVGNYLAIAILFTVWGFSVSAAVPAIQHRLVSIDPPSSAMSLSWYTTVMYFGIGAAPLLGALVISLSDALTIPLFGAVIALLALLVFQLGFLGRRRAPGDR